MYKATFSFLLLVLLLFGARAAPGRMMLQQHHSCWDANGNVWVHNGNQVKCTSGSGMRKCHQGSWQDNECFIPQPPPLPPPAISSCKDPDTGNMIPHGSTVNCKSGSGTRKCNFGRWEDYCRVTPARAATMLAGRYCAYQLVSPLMSDEHQKLDESSLLCWHMS
jgi:hypothetical protein